MTRNYQKENGSKSSAVITFYMPSETLPSSSKEASWKQGNIPTPLLSGNAATAQSWLFQTWVELQALGETNLRTEFPSAGIIITLSKFLPRNFRASSGQFVVAVAADFLPHSGAHVQIVQNAAHSQRLPGALFMPHWPQANLVPRHPSRGSRVETIAFFGDPLNLAPELQSHDFAQRLKRESCMHLQVRKPELWHDYSDVDIVLAVRDFTRSLHLSKPATKLYNAWLAGVPLIGGRDSAFAAEGDPGLTHLVASSAAECCSLARDLARNPDHWGSLVREGRQRSASRTREAVRELWASLCFRDLPAMQWDWIRKSPFQKSLFWQKNRLACFLDRKIRS